MIAPCSGSSTRRPEHPREALQTAPVGAFRRRSGRMTTTRTRPRTLIVETWLGTGAKAGGSVNGCRVSIHEAVNAWRGLLGLGTDATPA